MIGWRSLGCMVLVAGLVGLVASRDFVQAQGDKDKLEWKAFDKGAKPFYQVLTTKTVQTMSVMNMDIKQEQNQTFYILWTPQDPDKDGNWVVKQRIIGVKMDIDIGGNKITYDSTSDQAPKNPMSEFFEALISPKTELTFTIKKDDFSIVKVDGADDFRKKLANANPQITALLNSILSEGALKQMAEPTWAAFPSPKVQKEEDFIKKKTWKKVSSLDLGPIGLYDFTNNYTLGEKDKVAIKSEVEYKAPAAAKKEGLPFVITKGSLKTEKSDGYAQIDPAKGRLKDSKLDMELKGTLTIDIGGMVTDVTLQQVQNSRVETQDDDPVEAIKKAKK